MQKQSDILKEEGDLPVRDEVTKNKIDRHLSDEKDTISEEDIKNINTDINTIRATANEKREADLKDYPKNKEGDIEPEKEAPLTWDILD